LYFLLKYVLPPVLFTLTQVVLLLITSTFTKYVLPPVLFTLTQVVLLLIASTFTRVQIQSNLGTTEYIPRLSTGL
jgi:hypothetical protein